MERTWDKKSIYHSHLVGYTREHDDGLVCMIEAGPMKSKFGDGEVAKIKVHGEPEGEESGYWLKIENDDVSEAISAIAPKQWVSLRAEGSREAATIVVDTVDGLTVTIEQDTTPAETEVEDFNEPVLTEHFVQVAKDMATEQQLHESAVREDVLAGLVASGLSAPAADMVRCLLDARQVVGAFKAISGDEEELREDVRCLAQSLWINSH